MSSPAQSELLGSLLDEHGAALELFAAQWTDAAEDCVQEALIELAKQKAVPHQPAAWLYRVVRNRAIGRVRSAQRRRKHERLAALLAPAWSNPADEPAVTAEELAKALAELDESLREVVVARTWGGLSFEQIGKVIGASTSAAHRRYEAGLADLRRRLPMAGDDSADPRPPIRRNST